MLGGPLVNIQQAGMDLYKAIRDLYAEKERLERVIASLEELQRKAEPAEEAGGTGKRRGRKSMSAAERKEVSQRMKTYWEGRRRNPGKLPESGSS